MYDDGYSTKQWRIFMNPYDKVSNVIKHFVKDCPFKDEAKKSPTSSATTRTNVSVTPSFQFTSFTFLAEKLQQLVKETEPISPSVLVVEYL